MKNLVRATLLCVGVALSTPSEAASVASATCTYTPTLQNYIVNVNVILRGITTHQIPWNMPGVLTLDDGDGDDTVQLNGDCLLAAGVYSCNATTILPADYSPLTYDFRVFDQLGPMIINSGTTGCSEI
ncbi:hypothetical protein [Pseudovibrio ascidiaceicola]|uniref:hypothetical protein n=1 Tax=Pseudovibrio ascidiaceicola TaxID=285279 RepID=UPI001356C711|nr:hypothetical protein [Pseudovibrio ascidiaceicola]